MCFDGEPVPVGPKAQQQLAGRFQKFAAQPLPRVKPQRGVAPEAEPPWTLPVTFAATQMPRQLQRSGEVIDVVVPMDTVCAHSVVVMKEPVLNAFADARPSTSRRR